MVVLDATRVENENDLQETVANDNGQSQGGMVDSADDAEASRNTAVAEPTDEAQAAFDERRRQLEERIGQLAIEQARLKSAIKSNREELGEYTDDLRDHLLRGPVRLPLFDQKPTAEAEAVESANDETQPPDDETWRDLDIGEALPDLSEKILEVLQEHGLNTMGDLADVAAIKGRELSQLKGVTEKRLAKLEFALEKFWAARKGNVCT